MTQTPPPIDPVGKNFLGGFIGPAIRQAVASADRTSLASLVFANLMPILFAIVFRWDIGGVAMFYWWENIVIGGFAILRMALAKGRNDGGDKSKLFLIPFFCFHYYFFCMVHGVFLLVFLSGDAFGVPFEGFNRGWPGPLFVIPMFGGVISAAWNVLPTAGAWSLLLLVASHGVSFWRNYVKSGEYLTASTTVEMFRPYQRIVLLHVCIIFGGFITFFLGSPMILVIVLMLGKTILDIAVHSASHRRQK